VVNLAAPVEVKVFLEVLHSGLWEERERMLGGSRSPAFPPHRGLTSILPRASQAPKSRRLGFDGCLPLCRDSKNVDQNTRNKGGAEIVNFVGLSTRE